MELQPTPVEREARRFGLPVLTPATLRTAEAQEAFRAHGADAAVVVAYGLILPKPILDAVPLGCFNLHASLLPRWRGAAPIHRAIMAGDAETGVMVMRMEEGLDTGPIALADRAARSRRHDDGRTARRAGAARRRPDGARARARWSAARLTLDAAAGSGRHLCGEDRQGRDPHRLVEAWQAGARPHPRAVAVSRARGSNCRRRAPGARKGAAHDPGRGKWRARHRARRPAHHRLRRWRGAHHAIAAAGAKAMTAEEFLRGASLPAGTRLA